MTEPNPLEPSMDEILASIRRIISEDEASIAPGALAHAPAGEPPGGHLDAENDDDVLILTERAPPEPGLAAIFRPEPEPEPQTPAAMEPAPPTESRHPSAHHHHPAPAPVQAAPAPAPVEDSRVIVAKETAISAAASFQKLSFVVDNAAPPSRMSITTASPTIEDLTRDLLRPMLKSWLDEHLPAIVRARVDEEVERIARGRVR